MENKVLLLGGRHRIQYDMDRDMLWRWDQVLKTHPNGMRFSAFGEEGDLLATNEYFSVGGGFVVNDKTKGMRSIFLLWNCHVDVTVLVDENLFYKAVDKSKVHGARLHQHHSESVNDQSPAGRETEETDQPPYPFDTGNTLLALTKKHNVRLRLGTPSSHSMIIPSLDDNSANSS